MRHRRLDRVSLVAGIAFVLLGALLCLDQLDLITLGWELAGAAICAAVGAFLVAAGLTSGQEDDG